MSAPKICKLFLDIHMGLSHDGLGRVAARAKVKLDTLEDGDLLMFCNRKGDKMKVLGARGKVIGYLRMPDGNKIMRDSLQFIPHTFGATGFNYDAAVSMALEKRLGMGQKLL